MITTTERADALNDLMEQLDVMRLVKTFFKRETLGPLLALALATFACLSLVAIRMTWVKNVHNYTFLVWNLFLAWLPLIFAVLAHELHRDGLRGNWRFFGLTVVWLLFYPNAPYILTDLIHLWLRFSRTFWTDLPLILMFALTGLVLGFFSLYLMQSVVARMFGRIVSWLFVALASALCSVGVYLGRFMRFNSWDAILRPQKIFDKLDSPPRFWPFQHSAGAFLFYFAALMFIAYVLFYALSHLPKLEEAGRKSDGK